MKNKVNSIPYYHEIREACAQTGCPFCRLTSRSVTIYIDSILWEMVNDPGIRQELNQARGYCPDHSWLLVRGGAALGVTILMQDVVHTLLDVLASYPLEAESGWKQLLATVKTNNKVVQDISPQKPCPICVYAEKIEQQLGTTLLKYFSGPNSLAEVYQDSSGLCLPHLRHLLSRTSAGPQVKALLKAQKVIWERLDADLVEFIRKSDYRNKSEPFGIEKDAWLRALEAVAGASPQQAHSSGLTQSL